MMLLLLLGKLLRSHGPRRGKLHVHPHLHSAFIHRRQMLLLPIRVLKGRQLLRIDWMPMVPHRHRVVHRVHAHTKPDVRSTPIRRMHATHPIDPIRPRKSCNASTINGHTHSHTLLVWVLLLLRSFLLSLNLTLQLRLERLRLRLRLRVSLSLSLNMRLCLSHLLHLCLHLLRPHLRTKPNRRTPILLRACHISIRCRPGLMLLLLVQSIPIRRRWLLLLQRRRCLRLLRLRRNGARRLRCRRDGRGRLDRHSWRL